MAPNTTQAERDPSSPFRVEKDLMRKGVGGKSKIPVMIVILVTVIDTVNTVRYDLNLKAKCDVQPTMLCVVILVGPVWMIVVP